MRILHIVRQFSPAVGGLENFVLCLAQAQIQAGHQPEVLTLNSVFHRDGKPLLAVDAVDGVPVHRVPWKGSYKYPIALSAGSHLQGFDIIHVHAVDFFADYIALLRCFHKTPLILSTHGGYFHSGYASGLKKVFFNTVTRFSMRGYQRVIACSEGDYAQFSAICKPWLRLIENGVDIDKFAKLGAQDYSDRYLFIGRFSNNKRIDLLIETIYFLKKITANIHLTIIGRDWDGNLLRMQDQIARLDLSQHVTILLDLDDDGIKTQVGLHNFIVSASNYEGFGMTLVEGMAAGLVPIASPITSFTKIIHEADVGHIVSFDTPESAAQNIANYTQSIQARYFEVRAAAITAAARYGWTGTAARFMQVYEEVLGLNVRVIQGVAIDTRSADEVIQAIDHAVEQHTSMNIAIANAHTVNLARESTRFKTLLAGFLVLNDGAGVNLASKWKYGKSFCENLNGTDFTPRLLANSTHSLRVFLLGARPDSVAAAFEALSKCYPQHQWLGYQDGYFSQTDEDTVCARIKQNSPDLLLVAMGNPLQEEWIARCSTKTGATICIGVGALFDFVSGRVERAPLWVRKLKCEWVFRLIQEPKRMWRRYLIGNLSFLWAMLWDRV
jgi:alpha-1,3-mannosyltransferase